ncbi:hypothetical protein, partial [uncultured Holdemanella sp.]|uniref:hypothetical protein n=1 Tax=uncultured Holdemanella sp. TaxID=1763549 RepID=UPI0028052261
LPSPMTSLSTACGSLHLAVTTRGWFNSNWTHAMPGTHKKDVGLNFQHLLHFSRGKSHCI